MLPKNCIRDEQIDYRLAVRDSFPSAWVTYSTASGGTQNVATLSAGFDYAALILIQPMGASRQLGARFSSIGNYLSAPQAVFPVSLEGVDNRQPVYFRVCWSTEATAANVQTRPVLVFSTISDNQVTATPSTTLTHAIATDAKTNTTAHRPTWSDWGMITASSGGSFAYQTFDPLADGLLLGVRFASITNAAVATDFLWMLRLQMAFTPRMTFGYGSTREAHHVVRTLQDQAVPPTLEFATTT